MKGVIFLLLFIAQICNGQNYGYTWIIGGKSDSSQSNVIIKFSDSQPAIALSTNSFVPIRHSNASISDSLGNLLFYTNGLGIYNKNYQLIPGAVIQNNYTLPAIQYGLNWPNSFVFLPWPEDSNRFVLIYGIPDTTVSVGPCAQGWPAGYIAGHLRYTILDKTLNFGTGGVVSANNIAFNGFLARFNGLATVKHANGRDWWIVVKNACDDGLQTLLLTSSGITHIGQHFPNLGFTPYKAAIANFSPDGAFYSYVASDSEMVLIRFDRCSGVLDTAIILPSYNGLSNGHAEFSPNSKLLYRNLEGREIIQYDLNNYSLPNSVLNSAQVVGVTDTFTCTFVPYTSSNYLYYPKLGADGKIYFAHNFECDRISCINQPDSLGIDCAPTYYNFILPTGAAVSLSNTPNYKLGALPGSICDSLTTGLTENITTVTSLSPNPASNSFVITLNQHQSATIELYSMEGKKVDEKHFLIPANSLPFDLEPGINPGLYVVRIHLRDEVISRKVVVKGN